MSFLYPRTIAITRPGAQSGVGAQGYGGMVETAETLVASDLPASIQERREGRDGAGVVPGDAPRPSWFIYIPRRSAALGTIMARDVVTDEIGTRYQVAAPYWDSLGYRLAATTLET